MQLNLLCWPALGPQMTGVESPDDPVTTKESKQASVPVPVSKVVLGPRITKVSKSKRIAQILLLHFLMV